MCRNTLPGCAVCNFTTLVEPSCVRSMFVVSEIFKSFKTLIKERKKVNSDKVYNVYFIYGGC